MTPGLSSLWQRLSATTAKMCKHPAGSRRWGLAPGHQELAEAQSKNGGLIQAKDCPGLSATPSTAACSPLLCITARAGLRTGQPFRHAMAPTMASIPWPCRTWQAANFPTP